MTLPAGVKLGAYEIMGPLGSGGMGEVYRARDTKLGREVAVKVLPETVSSDPERLARFEREARSLASVNHPNIVTIYAVEEAGGVRLLAMELVEGKTLDLVTPSDGLPLSRFFEIAVPLADALSAAHERGIIHRDLKPGNVMLTADGRVKVLDFGLAKLDTPSSDPNVTDMPTESRVQLTGEGTVFGTVAYMSPEQARGGKLDARSDVFSLGIVLYEMLTGDRPFTGASSVDLISSILRDQPSPVTEIRSDLPPHIGRVLRRCLEKNPRDRYQTSRDVFNELRELQAETSAPRARQEAPSAPLRARLDSGKTRAEEALFIAVLPFKRSGDTETEAFADGLGEEVATGLSRFRYLSVVAARVGARYALEGSIRKGGSAIRVSVQLVDTQTNAHLWAETYNRDLQTADIFTIQDDVAARIVATVADSYGVLVHSMRSAIRQKDDADLTPVEWQFQYFAYREQITPSAYAELKSRLERAVERDGRQSDLWACLAQIFVDEYAFGFGTDPAALDRALAAARRAVELDRANQFALVSLAQVHFFRQDLAGFGPAAERAMALNPLNTDALGILGLQIVHTGEFERGTAIVRRAMALNPNHAGWMHFAPLWNHFHKGEYEQALESANRVDVPGLFWPYLVMASACGHLGRRAEAEAAVRDLLALDPEFAAHARSNIGTWHFASGLMEPILEGLRKAGLSIPATGGSADAPMRGGTVSGMDDRAPSGADSSQSRADEGFWVAVLPFKYGGANEELKGLADGMSEEVVTGLSRFSYLRVIARGSTAKYSSEASDIRAVGRELGARYVMEGSLRQAGKKLRLAVQLVDATTGAHLWAESYERDFRPEAAFELQDDLVPRIVSTVADANGVLPRSMSESLRSRDPEQLSPYEAVLRSFGYLQRVTPQELAATIAGLESAVRKAPDFGDAWAFLAGLYVQDYAQGFRLQADSLSRGFIAAQRAVEASPTSAVAHSSLAQALFFRRELPSFRIAAERAATLNPMDGNTIAFLGELLTYSGDREHGLALSARAKELNPNHPGWYWYAEFYDAYRRGDDRAAIAYALKVNLPGQWFMHAALAAAYGQLGDRDAAAKALQDLLKARPDFAATARKDIGKWWEPEYVERMIEGWRKAGLEIADGPEASAVAGASVSASVRAAAAPASAAADVVAIAVLPFSDMSPAKDQEYLCEGMAEEIMNALVRVDGIRVASRSSAFRARQEGKDLPEIARLLSVSHALEGSVRTSGTRLRVTAQLTDVVTGYQLWSERFDRDAADIFAIQDEIAAGVVAAVQSRLAPGSHAVPARAHSPDLEAYRSYLKGRHLRGKEHLDGALRAFEEAVRLDPTHAPSWTGLAEATVLASVFGVIPPREACDTARKALGAATRLQGESADGLHVEGFIAWIEGRWAAMEAAWRRAIELQPTHVLSLASFGFVLCTRRRLDEGLSFLERARRADPLASFPYQLTGGALLDAGRPQEALRYLEDALSFEKEDAAALDSAGQARIVLGRLEEGIATLEHVVALSHRGAHFLGTLGWALATAGRKDEARKILGELRSRPDGSPAVVSEAWLLGALGEIDLAFEVVARAEEEHLAYLYFTGLPGFDPLRSDPRFEALQGRLGLTSSASS